MDVNLKSRVVFYLIFLCLLFAPGALAQHDHGDAAPRDSVRSGQHDMHDGMQMSGTLLPDVPMQQETSGTGWQPLSSPMEGIHAGSGGWNLMFHGNAFLRLNSQDVFGSGTRGATEVDVPNWFMAMASRPLGSRSVLGLRAMFSLDAAIAGERGYPLLFQSGETFGGGQPLIDRQHPHDLFSELAISFGRRMGEKAGVFAYFALPGEPALGPPAFMHRPSAAHLPDSPIGHHWQDATHILFGVATLGFRYDRFKLDGSIFTGREPDENRFDIDRPRFDSYSIRLAANPSDRWATQVSTGFLKSPEITEPDDDVWRTTASAMYSAPFGRSGSWSSTFVWGQNRPAGHSEGEGEGHGTLNSYLVESDLTFGPMAIYSRAELTQKDVHELGLDHHDATIPVHFEDDETFNIGSWSLGAARDILHFGDLKLMLGGHGTIYRVPPGLEPLYGDFPVSAQVYLRLSPSRMRMDHGQEAGHGMHSRHGIEHRLEPERDEHEGHARAGRHGRDSGAREAMMHEEMHRAMEFVVRLLSDPVIESRIHEDPRLHELWADASVQELLHMMRQMHGLDASGAKPPTTGDHEH